jgi:hypothetical protein
MSETHDNLSLEKSILDLTKDDLYTLCKCNICYNILDTKCKSCINGHLTCSDCFEMLADEIHSSPKKCPCCRENMTNIKILFINQLYNMLNLSLKCKYENCKEILPINQYEEHIKKCKYQPFECKIQNCKYIFTNDIKENIKHFTDKHDFLYKNINKPLLQFICPYKDINFNDGYVFKLDEKTLYLVTSVQYEAYKYDDIYEYNKTKFEVNVSTIFIDFIRNDNSVIIPKYKIEIVINDIPISIGMVNNNNNNTPISYSLEQVNMLSNKEKNTFNIKLTKLDN